MRQSSDTQSKALWQLIEFAIDAEYLGVWSHEDREEFCKESGKPMSDYEAPYFRSCGIPLGK
jgi:hypothetical protein